MLADPGLTSKVSLDIKTNFIIAAGRECMGNLLPCGGSAVTKAPAPAHGMIIGIINAETFEQNGPWTGNGISHIPTANIGSGTDHQFTALGSRATTGIQHFGTKAIDPWSGITVTDGKTGAGIGVGQVDAGIGAVTKIPADLFCDPVW